MVSAGSYILSAALLATVAISLGFAAIRLRQRLIPDWTGAPAHLVESVLGLALVLWLSELLGLLNLLYAWSLVLSSLAVAGAIAFWTRPSSVPLTGNGGSGSPERARRPVFRPDESASSANYEAKNPAPARGTPTLPLLIAIGAIAVVFAHWGLTTKDALDRGIFNFDSLWYHMPFAAEIAQSHSVTGLHYTETVFTNWFYPQNSELLHAVGIVLTERDTLSLFINFAFLAIAFLAAWCVGRPYGRGPHSVVAAAILLECHTLVVREPGAAKNDLMAAALLLAAIAILIVAWQNREPRGSLPLGWPLAAAGLAVGLAVGTKVTAVAMAVALSVAVLALAPAGRRLGASGWWFLPALAGGGFWYLRNLFVAGNPLPQVESIGPIALPHPERLQSGRPDFSIVHYATDTAIWREYFVPGLHDQFGLLWPLVVGGAVAGALLALFVARDRVVRWMGGVALFGLVAYLFTPLSAAGAEGAPVAFDINVRFAIPALLAGAVLVPLGFRSATREEPTGEPGAGFQWGPWLLLGALLAVMAITNRADAVLRDPARGFGLLVATLLVLIPAALLLVRARGASRRIVATGFALLALAMVAIGYPVQRDYLGDRFAAGSEIPGMHLESAYQRARDLEDVRIGLAGTTAGFLQYGLYGTDLSNRVRYLGEKGSHGAFNAIPTCAEFRAAVNDADLDYLITTPFLNFIHPDEPVSSREARWLRGEPAVVPVDRSGQVTVWRVDAPLDPANCGPANAPLRDIPQTPSS